MNVPTTMADLYPAAGCKTDVSYNSLRGCPTRRMILGDPDE